MEFIGGVVCIAFIILIAVVFVYAFITFIIRRIKRPKLKDVLAEIEKSKNIGSDYFDKLVMQGIKSTDALIKKGASPDSRKEIENTTGIASGLILKWISFVDLLRIRDITIEYIYLLRETGVKSVFELAQRNPEMYHKILVKTNEEKKFLIDTFSVNMVRDWIEQAKKFPQIIKY
ncbi:MAG: DUF4332 domain-containing protein [Actinobacteria bacterium]|nr:DUF4332 domain-containing protein [Actinomycetota bacterium]